MKRDCKNLLKNAVPEEKETEQLIFHEMLPEKILDQLTPEIRQQYFIWDEIHKREIELHPWLALPLIEETFHKKYSKDVEIKLLSTEYVVDRVCDHGERTLNSIHADMLLQLGSRDLYHFECQIEKDRDIILNLQTGLLISIRFQY